MAVRPATIRSLVALTAAAIPIALTPPASAESTVVLDAHASSAFTDIHKVAVDHATKRVFVKITVDDIPNPDTITEGGGATVYFDTDPDRPGPERALLMPLTLDSDWVVVKVKDWETQEDPLSCASSVGLNPTTDVARTWVSRKCLGKPDQVRVAVRTSLGDGSQVDWMSGYRDYTEWLSRD